MTMVSQPLTPVLICDWKGSEQARAWPAEIPVHSIRKRQRSEPVSLLPR